MPRFECQASRLECKQNIKFSRMAGVASRQQFAHDFGKDKP
jgi:hypothetical protein